MKTKRILLLLACILLIVLTAVLLIPRKLIGSTIDDPKSLMSVVVGYTDSTLGKAQFDILEPVSFKNLQIFPIRGTFNITERRYYALEEAMEKKMVEVIETEQVNELKLNNNSDEYVFLHSGDIVKGGKQDRTIQYDVIIPPHEKSLPIASFCVERGRWAQRSGIDGSAESVQNFSTSKYNVSSRKMKVAAKKKKDQGEMWKQVSIQQDKIAANVAKNYDSSFYLSNASPTSMQLTLEDSTIKALRKMYKDSLRHVMTNSNVVGFAYAINGEVYGVDVFNASVFDKLQEKMIDGYIVEAVADQDTSNFKPAKMNDVFNMLQKPDGKADDSNRRNVNRITHFEMEVFGKNNRFLTTDIDMKQWLHLNVIFDDEESEVELKNGSALRPVPSYLNER